MKRWRVPGATGGPAAAGRTLPQAGLRLALVLISIFGPAAAVPIEAESPAFASVDTETATQIDPEIAEFNRTVTDAEIEEFLRFGLQFDPVQLQEWTGQSEADRMQSLARFRQSFVARGERIPVLRGRSEGELEQLRLMAMFAAQAEISLRRARALLPGLNQAQLQSVREQCVELLSRNPGLRSYRNVPTPAELEFLKPDLVRIERNTCTVFLQKGIGRGYGLQVRKTDEGWRLYRFDEYESWDRHEIELQPEH